MRFQAPRGTFDILPDEEAIWNQVQHACFETARLFGYRYIETPIFEESGLFERTVGEDTDIVEKEMYSFEDKGGENISLRPENTAGVCRAFIENGLHNTTLPSRLFYYGPMFRYERPQKGRLRQFKQFGIECLGLASSMADIEVISLGYELLSKLNVLEKIDLKINTLGDFESRNNYRNALIDYLNGYKSSLSKESLKRLSINPLRILDSKNEDDQKIIENAPNIIEYLNLESKTRFENICKGLDYLNIEYKIDKNLVRGLDYYCHTAFEFITDQLGAQGTVLAGGRYDGLSKMLGGVDVAGVGWAAGIERLALMVQSEYINNPDIVLMAQTEVHNHLLLPIMNELVNQGFKAEIIYTGNMSKKFKRANKINASYAILLGEEEVAKKVIKLKNLSSGLEQLIDLNQGIKILKKTLHN